MVISRQREDPHLKNILLSTRGIIFLGTPHHGAGLARWAELLSRSIGFIKQTNAPVVEVLKRDSEVLARIQDSFHTMVMARNREGRPVEITCFFEELPLPGVGQVSLRVRICDTRLTDGVGIGRTTALGHPTRVYSDRDPR